MPLLRGPALRTSLAILGAAFWATSADVATAELRYRTHWLGQADEGHPAQTTAESLAVAADGTCVVGSSQAPDAPSVVLYRDGQIVGRCPPLPGPGWAGGAAVNASDQHLFVAVSLTGTTSPSAPANTAAADGPPAGSTWHGLCRLTRDGTLAPFPGGRAPGAALLVVHEAAAGPDGPGVAAVGGLWVHEGEVFVSDTATNRIRVYDELTMKEKRAFPSTRPSRLCVLSRTLYVIERGAVVSAFTLNGRRTGQVLDEGDALVPGALAPTPEGRLLVSDLGPGQQVHFFNMSGVPTRVRTLGEENGLYGPPAPGETGPRRLAHVTGVGADANGRLYVAMNPPPGGCVLRSFEADRKTLRWQWLGLDLAGGVDGDPASDGLDVFSSGGRHALDLTKPPGASWRWVAQTLNPFRYPYDPRRLRDRNQGGTTTIREIEGKKFLVHGSSDGARLGLHRFQGQTAVPSMLIDAGENRHLPGQPDRGPWVWRDGNGDGRMEAGEYVVAPVIQGRWAASPIDSRGGLWRVGADGVIHHWPCRGLDDRGLPLYETDPATSTRAPAGLAGPLGLHYDATADVLYLAGVVSSGEGATAASVLRVDAWSADAATSAPRWHTPLPIAPGRATPPAVAAAGELVFILDPATAHIHVLEAPRGTVLGQMAATAEKNAVRSPMPATALRAHRRQDGSYLVYTQDTSSPRALVHHLENPLGASSSKKP